MSFQRVALLGCGHIGGSLALALRAADPGLHVVGFDADATAAEEARARGLCDSLAASAAAAVAGADLVVLAVPVRAIGELARAVAHALAPATVVMDVGSTKADVVAACEAALAGRARFVGAHPMAGTERSGPASADATLFGGRTVILTPTPASDAAALAAVTTLWQALGARVVLLGPDAHDAAVAGLSHLPHVAAFALAGAVAHAAPGLAGLAGGSFDSGTRVAASAPAAWVDILLANRTALLPWIDAFAVRVAALRAAIAAGDSAALHALLAEAQAARATILGR